jgi:hypothetical protein
MRIELTTSSLPRKCSTPELQQLLEVGLCVQPNPFYLPAFTWSGRPGSNWPPIAWKAIALPNELLPQKKCGQNRFRTYVLLREQIYSLSPLTTRPSAHSILQIRAR